MCYPRPTCSSPSSSSKTRTSLKAIHERIKAGCQVSGWRNPINTIYCSPSFYATESFLIQRFFCLDGLPVGDEDPKGLYRDSFDMNIFRLWRTSFVRSRRSTRPSYSYKRRGPRAPGIVLVGEVLLTYFLCWGYHHCEKSIPQVSGRKPPSA